MTANLKRCTPAIERYIRLWMKRRNVPGLSLAITDRRRLLQSSCHGFSNMDSREPVTEDTLFEIGSISKSFACACIMQLADEGRVAPEDSVERHIPWLRLRYKDEPVTLHHLMSHTAGIIQGMDSAVSGLPECWTLKEFQPSVRPGTHYRYSNVGYKVLGLVLERLEGKRGSEVIQERILDPLGMRSSHTTITTDLRGLLAAPYEHTFDDRPVPLDAPVSPATWIECETVDGSISSTPTDMARYVRMLLNRGKAPRGRLISEKGYGLMTQRVVRTDDEHEAMYGYGLVTEEHGGVTYLSHTGGMVGYHSAMMMDPEDGIGVFATANGPDGPADVSRFILQVMRADSRGQALPKAVPPDPTLVADAPDYSGTFGRRGHQLHFKAKGERLLMMHGRRPVVLERREKDMFFADHPAFDRFLVSFERKGGKVTDAFYGEEWYPGPLSDKEASPPHPEDWEGFTGHYRSYNPWLSNFRVVLRRGVLVFVNPTGKEEAMRPMPGGWFQVGDDERSPERLRFDMTVDGKAHVAVLSGGVYHRTFTP